MDIVQILTTIKFIMQESKFLSAWRYVVALATPVLCVLAWRLPDIVAVLK